MKYYNESGEEDVTVSTPLTVAGRNSGPYRRDLSGVTC
jgi:hypothetical protein